MSGIMFLADLHAGMSTHDAHAATGASWRAAECREVVREAVSVANERDAHLVLPGDVFHTRKPPAWAYLAVGEELSRANREVYAMTGNHDAPGHGDTTPLGVLSAYGVHVITRAVVEEVGGFEVLFLPWASRAWMDAVHSGMQVAEQHRIMSDSIRTMVGAFVTHDSGKPRIAVIHNTIAGSTYNSGTQPMLGDSSEFMIPLPSIAHPRLEAVFAGHIHKPQTIEGGGCPVHYIGSAVRHDFGEENQPCRMLYVEDYRDTKDPLSVYLESARQFKTLEVTAGTEHFRPTGVNGVVARIKGTLPAGPEGTAVVAEAHRMLEEAGVLKVGKPSITFARHDAPKRSGLDVRMAPERALAMYCDEVGGDYAERRDALLELHREVAS